MKRNLHFVFSLVFSLISMIGFAQETERIVGENIATVQLHKYGNQQSFPVYILGSNEQLTLDFDDLEGGVKSYYYTYVLCDYNWKPANVSSFDYIKGFTQNRITTYRNSSIALTRYTHYQVYLPEANVMPKVSGNYLIKVYLNGDTSQLAFTKRMVVVDPQLMVQANVVQPFSPDQFKTHQQIRFTATSQSLDGLTAVQQVKAVVLQNNRWDNAIRDISPSFVRGKTLDFTGSNIALFPAGKEWRWLDMRSVRLLSDRIRDGVFAKDRTDLYMRIDRDRRADKYNYFMDFNGMYDIQTYETVNPLWQGDYATVHFEFQTPDELPYTNADIYLNGAFTGYQLNDKWKMTYDEETKTYRVNAFLKQGYYNYQYILQDRNDPSKIMTLEGDYFETENQYTILFYYKGFSDRNDKIIGISQIESRTDRPGFSF